MFRVIGTCFQTWSRSIPRIVRQSLLATVVLIILMAGLDPKEYRFHNEVTRLADRPGLRFGKFGRVHTGPFINPERAAALNRDGFTLELAVSLTNSASGDFRILASFHAGDDRSQLIVGQWRQHFIVMNGDDYNNRRRLPRISTDASARPAGPIHLLITTGPEGTQLYLNGKVAGARANLRLMMPSEPKSGRLVLGNSVHANNPWRAEIHGFAAYSGALTSVQAGDHFARWQQAGDFSFAQTDDPLLRYTFARDDGDKVLDQGALKVDLEIPTRLVALGTRALATLHFREGIDRSLALDMIVNLIGFIPFGLALAFAGNTAAPARWRMILRITAVGFLLSLFIEVAQAWLPSRDSSFLDLLLNTAGAFLGAGLWALMQIFPARPPRP